MEPHEAQNLSFLSKFAKKRHETNCDKIFSYDFIHLHGARNKTCLKYMQGDCHQAARFYLGRLLSLLGGECNDEFGERDGTACPVS